MSLYPLKFEPRYLEKMWGGRKIETVLGKKLPSGKPIGESWEIYDFPPGVIDQSGHWVSSRIVNGPKARRTLHELMLESSRELLGDVQPAGPHRQFPLLIKFLDAQQDLSVQVHPDREYARKHADAHLKSEAWFIVQADAGARLLKGLKTGTTRELLHRAVRDGKVEEMIKPIAVSQGDCFYLPSGTVHALGAGILAAEVQTPSDTTFRVHDFDRVDPSTGKKRTLHVDQAMQCIDFSGAEPAHHGHKPKSSGEHLVGCEFFGISRLHAKAAGPQKLNTPGPLIWMMLEGNLTLRGGGENVAIARGDTVLLPASMPDASAELQTDCQWVEVTFPTR